MDCYNKWIKTNSYSCDIHCKLWGLWTLLDSFKDLWQWIYISMKCLARRTTALRKLGKKREQHFRLQWFFLRFVLEVPKKYFMKLIHRIFFWGTTDKEHILLPVPLFHICDNKNELNCTLINFYPNLHGVLLPKEPQVYIYWGFL